MLPHCSHQEGMFTCKHHGLQGASKQGITEHLKVKKKQDALGVGAVIGQAPIKLYSYTFFACC